MGEAPVDHPWDLTPAQARALQADLSQRIIFDRPLPDWTTLAAADVSMDRGSPTLYASVVVVRRPGPPFEVVEVAGVAAPASFPYVPGLLSFREAPAVLAAWDRLTVRPDVLLCDGQGRAHPRRLGIASHIGLHVGIPTIGCAKSRLCGRYDEPGQQRGDRSPLIDKGEVVGAVIRSRARAGPLFISPGHLCSLEAAVELVLSTLDHRRLPEPIRLAHDEVNRLRRSSSQPD